MFLLRVRPPIQLPRTCIAIYFICFRLKSLNQLRVFYSIIALNLILISYYIYNLHPFQSFYFNSLSNKNNSPIHERFQVDYWGISGTHFLKYVLKAEKAKEKISVATAAYVDLERSKKLLDIKSRKKINLVGQEFSNADYIYTNFTSEVDKRFNNKYEIPSNFKKIYTLEIDNIVVYDVYRKNN